MTTVIDPLSTPIPVYNRSGVAIVSVTSDNASTPAPIPTVSGTTVVLVTRGVNGGALALPTGRDIGDVVELYSADGSNNIDIYPSSGETFLDGASSRNINPVIGGYLRKVGPTAWGGGS